MSEKMNSLSQTRWIKSPFWQIIFEHETWKHITYSSFNTGLSIGAEVSIMSGFARMIALPLISIEVTVIQYLLPGIQSLIVYTRSLRCNSIWIYYEKTNMAFVGKDTKLSLIHQHLKRSIQFQWVLIIIAILPLDHLSCYTPTKNDRLASTLKKNINIYIIKPIILRYSQIFDIYHFNLMKTCQIALDPLYTQGA